MKKILSILALVASASLGFSQGTINFSVSSSGYAVSTNATSIGGGVGKTSTAAGGFYYALLIQTYTGAASSSISGNPLQGWTFSGNYATNSGGFAGAVAGGTQAVSGWTPGATNYVEVVGWSANEGTTWAQVAAQIASGNWQAQGFYGVSGVGYVTSGGAGVPATLPGNIFSPTGVPGSFQLVSTVPEPTTIALIGIGGLGLAMIRRKK